MSAFLPLEYLEIGCSNGEPLLIGPRDYSPFCKTEFEVNASILIERTG